MPDHGGQGAAVTDADDLALIALQDRVQIARAGKGQRLERQPGFTQKLLRNVMPLLLPLQPN